MASKIREYAKIEGLTMDWLGRRAVPSPKTMITFRSPQVGLSFTMDVDCNAATSTDGITPDPTASKAINTAMMAIAVALRHCNKVKPPEARRENSMIKVII